MILRIGVVTGDEDCPGLHTVIRAVAKSAHHRKALRADGVVHRQPGWQRAAERGRGKLRRVFG